MTVDPMLVIERFYPPDTVLYRILVDHSRIVARKSLAIARNIPHLKPDLAFIESAAMLHDIGIFLTRANSIGCTGDAAYLCHGYLGRQLLDDLGLPQRYGLVCERHTGAGISKENILENNLPLPLRDMVPVTLEEKIICVADKYHSKNPARRFHQDITTEQVIQDLETISPDHARRFSIWAGQFYLT